MYIVSVPVNYPGGGNPNRIEVTDEERHPWQNEDPWGLLGSGPSAGAI